MIKNELTQPRKSLPRKILADLPDFPAFNPEQLMPSIERILQDYQSGVERSLSERPCLAKNLLDCETRWADELERTWSPASHLNSVSDNEELRTVYNKAIQRLTEHANWRQQHAGLFAAYRDWRSAPDFQELAPELQRLISLEVKEFELSGVGLPPEQQAIYREIMLRKSKLGAQFSENVLDATQAWNRKIDRKEDLDGLPTHELELLAGLSESQFPDEDGGWLVNLSQPSYQAVMMHATNRELRQEVYWAYVTRASDTGPNSGQWDNSPLINEILDLRHKLATLLGFDNFVEYAVSRRMAGSGEVIARFLNDIADEAVPVARQQLRQLEGFASDRGAELPLQAWDVAFWSERFRQQELQLSDEELKPYFPLDQMIAAIEYTADQLFGIRLERDDTIATWHEDVQFYWIRNESGEKFSGIYFDLFSRKNKRGGAWMDVCQSRMPTANGTQIPVAYLTCNFSRPGRKRPSLLTHHDVQTLFHEFGHCLHHLLTKIDWAQINGIHGVEWDAVELPSQLMENWCWEKDLLNRFARHYETGEPLPGVLLERLLASRYFHRALILVRQLEYAMVDLRLHLEYDPDKPRDPREIIDEVRSLVAVVEVPVWNRFLHSFGHVFGGGYAAGYYSYHWANVLDADAYAHFQEKGIFDKATATSFRKNILEKGASEDPMVLYKRFRGSEPTIDAMLDRRGLN